jgi:D-alanyl-D-alanine carboxypeptidase
MIYKKYELSKSLNGESIITIARNYAGVVVFRGQTDEDVKEMIDNAIHEQTLREKGAEEKRLKKLEEKKNKKKKGLFQAPEEEITVEEEKIEEEDVKEESVLTPPQARVTRGPDGKFISKSQLQMEEEKKKTFWDKLTS